MDFESDPSLARALRMHISVLEGVHVPRGAFNYWGSFNYSGALLIIWGALLIIQGHF